MKLTSISIRNFRLHAATDIVFPPKGIIGIVGENEAGKSTILEAAVWALFGGDTTRGTKAGLRWHGAPARHTASVILWFEVGGKTYRVERGESSAKLFEEGKPIVEGVAAVNGYMPTLLGLTHQEFTASFFVKQKDVDRLATMLPTERVAFIRGLMGMSKIDAALKACRARKSALSQERDGLILGLGERGPLEEALEAAVARMFEADAAHYETRQAVRAAEGVWGNARAVLDRSAARKLQHEAHTRALAQAKTAREAALIEVGRLEVKLTQVAGARSRIEKGDVDLRAVPTLRAERDGLVAARGVLGERGTLTKRVAELEQEIDGPAGLREMIADAQRQVAAYDARAAAAAQAAARDADQRLTAVRAARIEARAAADAEAQGHHQAAERHQKRLNAIAKEGQAGACPTCLRALGDAYDVVVGNLTEQRDAERRAMEEAAARHKALSEPSDDELVAEAERDDTAAEWERWKTLGADAFLASSNIQRDTAKLAATEKALAEARARLARLPSATFDADRLSHVEAELQRLDRLDKALAADRALVAQEAEARDWLIERRAMLQAAEDGIAAAERGLAESGHDAQEHAKLAREEEGARRAAEAARVAQARADEAEKAATGRLQDARASLADYDTRAVRLEEVSTEHLRHERTAARLADFRVAIAATIRPEMEELMSGFVHLLTDGRHEAVTLDEDFNAVLHESGVPVEVISGGCEDIAALAMRLAISQMIAERAGHPLSLLILDEPFGSLSETRRGNVLSLIRRLRGVFEQVVVISHVAETRDAVDHVVEFEFDEKAGCARVVSMPEVEEQPVAEVA